MKPSPHPRPKSAIRLVTYNVHGLVGSDFRLAPERVLGVLQELDPDIVALQELYIGKHHGREVDQPSWLSEQLRMELVFGLAREFEGGRYGNAVLSRHPIRLVRAENLPQIPRCERRAALRVEVCTAWGELDLVNTHLGLRRHERAAQTRILLDDWLSHVGPGKFSIFCGDLNALPTSSVYRAFSGLMHDAQRSLRDHRPSSTWPALCPLLRLDHVFVSSNLSVTRCLVPRNCPARLASDHLPLAVDLSPSG